MGRTACIAGASGLVGSELLQKLLQKDTYSRVISFGRRELDIQHEKLQQLQTNFNPIQPVDAAIDDVFCCLGTTIKKAKSQTQMTKVDVTYPLNLAQWGLEHGAKQYLLISAMSANANAAFFYPRIKGKLEDQLSQLPYESIAILRPSLLLGDRQEFRFGEHAAATLVRAYTKLTGKRPSSRIAIEAETVAEGMINIAQQQKNGVNVYPSEQISLAAFHEQPSE